MLTDTEGKECAFFRTGTTSEPFGEPAFHAAAARVLCGQDAIENNGMRKVGTYDIITATLPQLSFITYTVSTCCVCCNFRLPCFISEVHRLGWMPERLTSGVGSSINFIMLLYCQRQSLCILLVEKRVWPLNMVAFLGGQHGC